METIMQTVFGDPEWYSALVSKNKAITSKGKDISLIFYKVTVRKKEKR